MSEPSVLFIGNFLSGLGGRRAPCEDLMERLRTRQWRIASSSSRPQKLLRLGDMMLTAIRRGREADVAHVDVFSGPAFVWAEAACWALRRAGCPYILTLHGGNLPAFAQRNPGRVRNLLRSAVAVTAPSGYLLETLRVYRSDIILLPNAIELASYPARVREPATPRLVWVRSFHSIYNPVMAPEVVARLTSNFPDVHLTMIGPDKDGSLRRTQAAAESLGVSDRIRFVAGVPKAAVPEYMNAADVFLNTTNIDNMPVTVVEAMACGLCVVSTDAGGVPWIVSHRRNGLLVPAGDAAAMTAAVTEVLTTPGLARTLSVNARQFAEPCDWSRVLEQWQILFTSFRGRRRG
jgi:glycosyltransferase involved in cell wall biosynthesis